MASLSLRPAYYEGADVQPSAVSRCRVQPGTKLWARQRARRQRRAAAGPAAGGRPEAQLNILPTAEPGPAHSLRIGKPHDSLVPNLNMLFHLPASSQLASSPPPPALRGPCPSPPPSQHADPCGTSPVGE